MGSPALGPVLTSHALQWSDGRLLSPFLSVPILNSYILQFVLWSPSSSPAALTCSFLNPGFLLVISSSLPITGPGKGIALKPLEPSQRTQEEHLDLNPASSPVCAFLTLESVDLVESSVGSHTCPVLSPTSVPSRATQRRPPSLSEHCHVPLPLPQLRNMRCNPVTFPRGAASASLQDRNGMVVGDRGLGFFCFCPHFWEFCARIHPPREKGHP